MKSKYILAIVCKTYSKDIKSFNRLFNSYKKHNIDNIKMYVSAPFNEIEMFQKIVNEDAIVISDESYAEKYFTKEEYWGLSTGYINQEICKLSFWENNFADNYLFVDSDAYFIRDFEVKDFMVDERTPYSVLYMDKDLNTQKFYRDFGKFRSNNIKNIFDEIGLKDKRMLTCHGMTILNSNVLFDFKIKFMQKRKLDYKDLIKISPYEYTWYNAWLQKSNIIDIVAVEPFFKTYHMRIEYILAKLSLMKAEYLAEKYVGIVLNSNWQPKKPPTIFEEPNKFYTFLYKTAERYL